MARELHALPRRQAGEQAAGLLHQLVAQGTHLTADIELTVDAAVLQLGDGGLQFNQGREEVEGVAHVGSIDRGGA